MIDSNINIAYADSFCDMLNQIHESAYDPDIRCTDCEEILDFTWDNPGITEYSLDTIIKATCPKCGLEQ